MTTKVSPKKFPKRSLQGVCENVFFGCGQDEIFDWLKQDKKLADPSNQDMEAIQKCQNKLLRTLNGTRVTDKISTVSLLTKFNILKYMLLLLL